MLLLPMMLPMMPLIDFELTTTDGIVLLSCYGQPAGHDPLSFQSIACAFLVPTWLIFLIVEHYIKLITDSIEISNKIHLYTDSLSMIKKHNFTNAYPAAHLKNVMELEWDILQALHRLMNQLNE